ncbi:hypothetical protein OG501_21830 [Streptomyces niveus]|uniref:Tat pathway signal sequence domain protein n=1 Tax=Streptomyces niveus TaxID=193462 RepID=A0ABZ2A7Q6_STRNV|nr:hypothetical protein [Streptomyces niveus]
MESPERPRPPRGRRTTALIAGAAVLGVLAGAVTGYAVQYQREPTPLPPLARAELRYPKPLPADAKTTARSLSAHRWDRTDGDLRELLVKKPKGARTVQKADWVDLPDYASDFRLPDHVFEGLVKSGFRRAATVHWSEGNSIHVTVTIVQFRDDERLEASKFAADQQQFMGDDDWAGNKGSAIAGTKSGRTWVFDEPERNPGYEPYYEARAVAFRGDVFMDISYDNNSGPVPKKAFEALVKRQLELL